MTEATGREYQERLSEMEEEFSAHESALRERERNLAEAENIYTCEARNDLTAIRLPVAVGDVTFNPDSEMTGFGGATLPNGVTVGYTPDQDSRISGLTYSAGSSQLGNLTYGYDADGRVTSKNGTLAAITLPSSVSGNTLNADNGMTGFAGATLSYDNNGNLISDGTNTYTWDARNHLTAISGGPTASLVYDAFGRRAQRFLKRSYRRLLAISMAFEAERELWSMNQVKPFADELPPHQFAFLGLAGC